MRRSAKSAAPAIIAFALTFGLGSTAWADVPIDLDRTGSITATVRDYETHKAIGGGELALYRIAGITYDDGPGYSYVYEDGFKGCDESLLNDLASASAPGIYVAWADEHGLSEYATADVGSDGKAIFDALPVGTYLATQAQAADGYAAISPFIVSVPFEENGAYVYDVDAEPKGGSAEAEADETEPEAEPWEEQTVEETLQTADAAVPTEDPEEEQAQDKESDMPSGRDEASSAQADRTADKSGTPASAASASVPGQVSPATGNDKGSAGGAKTGDVPLVPYLIVGLSAMAAAFGLMARRRYVMKGGAP